MLTNNSQALVHGEHRQISDRRDEDCGPPRGWRDRRIAAERRLPVVQEGLLTETEWFRFLASYSHQKKIEKEIHSTPQ